MHAQQLIDGWRFRAHRMQLAHYECSRRGSFMHLALGVPAIALSTIVGTSVFASLTKAPSVTVQIFVGLLSVVSAVLVSLQTFLKHSELSDKHRIAGGRYANIKHQLEILSSMPQPTDEKLREALGKIEAQWARLREDSPTLPTRIWKHIEKTVGAAPTENNVLPLSANAGPPIPVVAPGANPGGWFSQPGVGGSDGVDYGTRGGYNG